MNAHTRGAFTVRAPGKVMLFGEYAVVEGAPFAALVAGVARFATCRVEPGGEGVRLETTGLPAPVPPDDPRLVFVWQALAHCRVQPPGCYRLDTSAFHTAAAGGGTTKLGLGSSAAVTVALLGALHAAAGEDPSQTEVRDTIFAEALAAHRAASGGGSGADVAACTYGGLLRYTLPAASEAETHRPPKIERVAGAPPVLGLVFAGASADTRALLAQVRGLRGRVPAAVWDRHMRTLDTARRAGEAALAAGAAEAWRRAVTEGRAALLDLAAATGAPLRGPAETADAVDALASRFGGTWKTTGAGGGDLYWVVTPPEVALEGVEAAAVAVGLHWLTLPVSSEGVGIERV